MPETAQEKIEETFETMMDVQAFLRSARANMHVCSVRGNWITMIYESEGLCDRAIGQAEEHDFVTSVRRALANAMATLERRKAAATVEATP